MRITRAPRALYLAVCGTLLLSGCPGAGDFSDTSTAGFQTVQGIQGGTRTCKKPGNSEELIARVLELVNQEREKRGLNALTLNPTLSKIADDYCCAMIEGSFFDHVDPSGKGPGERAINAGYIFQAIGENLAGGQASAEQVMAEWMASTEGHRENILEAQWREIGVAVRTGGLYGVYWVQEFGSPP